jgi:hypothetical protein
MLTRVKRTLPQLQIPAEDNKNLKIEILIHGVCISLFCTVYYSAR